MKDKKRKVNDRGQLLFDVREPTGLITLETQILRDQFSLVLLLL